MLLRQTLWALGRTPEGKELIFDILMKHKDRLGEQAFWILEYKYYERLSNLNVGDKMNLSSSYYQQIAKESLSKLEMLLDDATNAKMLKLAKFT